MNKFLGVWGCLFFLMACGSSEQPMSSLPTTPVSHGIRIVAFGDSLTAGKDLEDPDREAYPAVLERELRAKGYTVNVTNAGHSGDTTFDALARLNFSLAEKPRVVIVGLGSNDTFQGKRLADMEKNLNEIVAQCQLAGATVVLCGMKTFPNLGFSYASDYAKLFKRVAKKNRAILVPFMLEGVAGDPALNLSDMIHPNPRGHEQVARNILPYVEQVLKKD